MRLAKPSAKGFGRALAGPSGMAVCISTMDIFDAGYSSSDAGLARRKGHDSPRANGPIIRQFHSAL